MSSLPSSLDWFSVWLDSVSDGSNTMSQRALTSIEKHGGLEIAKQEAQKRGIHLLLLEDDQKKKVVAASVKPFTVIC